MKYWEDENFFGENASPQRMQEIQNENEEKEYGEEGEEDKTKESAPGAAGSVFMGYEASEDLSDPFTILYGHNMADGSMFGQLKKLYNDPESLTIPWFFIELKDGSAFAFQIFAMVLVQKDSELFRIPAKENQKAYLQEVMQEASWFDADTPGLEEGTNLVMLSTCYGASGTNRRLLIYGAEQP